MVAYKNYHRKILQYITSKNENQELGKKVAKYKKKCFFLRQIIDFKCCLAKKESPDLNKLIALLCAILSF